MRNPGHSGGADHIACAEHVGRYRAVHLVLGEPGVPLPRHVEDNVAFDLAEDRGKLIGVPDIGIDILGVRKPRPSLSDATAHAHQAGGLELRQLGHQHRADATSAAADQDPLAVQAGGKDRIRQVNVFLGRGQESAVLLLSRCLAGEQRMGEGSQLPQFLAFQELPARRYCLLHPRDDLCGSLHLGLHRLGL